MVVTMGCGDACPFYPGTRYEDWVLDDPAGQGIETVRRIRDDIRSRVSALVRDLLGGPDGTGGPGGMRGTGGPDGPGGMRGAGHPAP